MWIDWLQYLASLDDSVRRMLPPVECVDLGERPELEETYGRRVPVLEADGREMCRYFFDPDAVTARLPDAD